MTATWDATYWNAASWAAPARAVIISSACTALLAVMPLAPAFGQDRSGTISGKAEAFAVSVPVRDLVPEQREPAGAVHRRRNPLAGHPDMGRRGLSPQTTPLDPLVRREDVLSSHTPGLSLHFNGTRNPRGCGGCTPPDPIGAVGPSHYVQMVNATKIAIYDKTGVLLKAPFNLGSLWPSGNCRRSDGDPGVRYDAMADRWVLSQLSIPNFDSPPWFMCFAVSQTADPLGAYYVFTFNMPDFPDYPKVGVWPNGYYLGTNETNYSAYAFDRTKMLAGDPNASFVRYTGQTNFLMPADMDGTRLPKGGGLFYTFKDDSFHGGIDRLELFRLTPDFVAHTLNFRTIASIPIAPFTYTPCGWFNLDCVPQKGTAQKVDAIGEWPMQRLVYRKFATHEVLVGNFTVGGGRASPGAAIRWFELRNTGRGWGLYQEGTQDLGDGQNRFMGSIAMDKRGNIALGYSVSSDTLFPSIRYATRRAHDPLGTLSPEKTLRAGLGSQTGSDRWGDYSSMAVDPTTDCQFWYTNEFYSADSATGWKTAVGAFTVLGCH